MQTLTEKFIQNIEEIKKLRSENLTFDEIAQKFNCSANPIYEACRRMGVSTRSQQYKNEEIYSKIVTLYQEGKPSREVAKLCNVSQKTVISTLKDRGIPRRPEGYFNWDRIYTINENYFEKIDSNEKAYVLGLFYTDGNVHIRDNAHVCSLTFKVSDDYLLKEVAKRINFNGPLFYRKDGSCATLRMTSKKMANDLINLGCIQRKSLILKFPTENQVPKEFIWHFLRGIFDGNGCISKKFERPTYGYSLISSFSFIEELDIFLQKELSMNGLIMVKNLNKTLHINRIEDVKKLGELFYKDSTICLERKFKKYQEFLALRKTVEDNAPRKEINGVETKRCYICLVHKPLNEFRNNKAKHDGKSCECKPCAQIRDSKYYERKRKEKQCGIPENKKLEM